MQPGKANTLEVELLAAGITIDGERRQQQQLLESRKLQYYWNCHFLNSGNFTLSLRLVAKGSSIENDFGMITHKIKVTKLSHMTKKVLSLILGFLSFPALLWGAINSIAQFIHFVGWH